MSWDENATEHDWFEPRVCHQEKPLWGLVSYLLVFALLAFCLWAICLTPIAKGDQEVSVKPGRLKKIESKLDSKKLVWRALGDCDLIEDSSGKFATTLFPTPGKFQILVVGAKADEPLTELITVTVQGDVPVPPGPGPGPNPPTPDNPAPIPGDGLRVLMIYEASDAGQPGHKAIFSRMVRDYLDAKCAKVGGTPEYRIYDKDIDVSRDAKTWQDAMRRTRTQTPWIIISNGKTGFEGPLPSDVPATLELLKKYGG